MLGAETLQQKFTQAQTALDALHYDLETVKQRLAWMQELLDELGLGDVSLPALTEDELTALRDAIAHVRATHPIRPRSTS